MENFYSIISTNIECETSRGFSTSFVIQINPTHVVFKGHFPGMPIVPGAFLVQLSQELLEQALNQKVKLEEAKSIKFLKMILPEHTTELVVNLLIAAEWPLREKTEKLKMTIEIRDRNSSCFKMIAEYKFD